MKYTVEERKERARTLRREGYNCAQCVAMAFDDIIPADRIAAVTLAAQGFGSGYGGRGYMCGALSGATMALGLTGEQSRPTLYKRVGELIDEFAGMEGAVNCSDLKKPGRKPCLELITDAVEILHRHIENQDV